MDYPEHEKLKKVSDKSQACGSFLDWLSTDQGLTLCRWQEYGKDGWDGDDGYYQANKSVQSLLAEFFDIDEKKLEAEKTAMLESIRQK